MIIDAQTSEITDTLKQLRELFRSHDNEADPLEVLSTDRKDAEQIKAFACMSGFKTALCHKHGHYCVSITGASCGCCR